MITRIIKQKIEEKLVIIVNYKFFVLKFSWRLIKLLSNQMEVFQIVALWKTSDNYLDKVLKIDNTTIATAGSSHNIEFWNLKNFKLMKTLQNSDSHISNILLLKKNFFLVISHDIVTIWKEDTIQMEDSPLRWDFDFCLNFDETLISLGSLNQIKTWNIEKLFNNDFNFTHLVPKSFENLKFLTNIQNKFIALLNCNSENEILIIKVIETLETIHEIKLPTGVSIFSLVYDEYLEYLYMGSEDGVLYFFDFYSLKITNSMKLGSFEISKMIMFNRFIVIGDLSNQLFVVNPCANQIVLTMNVSGKINQEDYGISDITMISDNSFACVDYSGYCYVLKHFPKFLSFNQMKMKLRDINFIFK
jgi:WD40 repeat protein